jgi:hypothetical protein
MRPLVPGQAQWARPALRARAPPRHGPAPRSAAAQRERECPDAPGFSGRQSGVCAAAPALLLGATWLPQALRSLAPLRRQVRTASSSANAPDQGGSAGSSKGHGKEEDTTPPIATTGGFQLKPIHIAIFSLIFIGGALFATMTLQFTADMEFNVAVSTVLRRVAKSVAFRQLVVIAVAILLVRFGLNSVLKALAKFSSSPVQWDKTKLFYILREVRHAGGGCWWRGSPPVRPLAAPTEFRMRHVHGR